MHLCALAEALTVCKVAGMDMNTAYEAIRISSGNSFVHETESQVILNGSRDIGFTMDLVIKDVGLFDQWAQRVAGAAGNIAAGARYLQGWRAALRPARTLTQHHPAHRRGLRRARCWAADFPAEMIDDEPEAEGYEVVPKER